MVPLLVLVYLGGYWLAALCIIVGAIGTGEFYKGFEHMGIKPSHKVAIGSLFLLYLIHGLWPGEPVLLMGWLVLSVMASCLYMFNITDRKPEDTLATITGIVYIIFFSYHVVLVDQSGEYSIFIWLILLCAFGSDVCAYFAGVFLGKHKMAPVLSPKKTWEGAVGGDGQGVARGAPPHEKGTSNGRGKTAGRHHPGLEERPSHDGGLHREAG